MNQQILWIGVAFEPDDASEYAGEQHTAIVHQAWPLYTGISEAFLNGTEMQTCAASIGTLVDLFSCNGSRIGFGVRVTSIAEGRAKMNEVTAWLRSNGITRQVSLWVWSPAAINAACAA